ncbi:MAG TPA: hypothetical protein PLM79_02210 [Syntrophobacteraceae bacterium]|nr:hypothetical protein [Syntrophobacteraceae bacterium]
MTDEPKGTQDACIEPWEGERAEAANRICCRACDATGVKVSSWEQFDAWKQYVDGKIEEAELTEQARRELDEFSTVFGKYLVIEQEQPKQTDKEAEKKKRARRANAIYREVCREAGLSVYFFHDFLSWSDFVAGNIGESEFYDRARREVMEIRGRPH